jgi:hypothetical protein
MPCTPGLSVIIPVRNGSAVLPRALAALRASDLPRSEWELIVVDDGSTDDSAAIAAADADHVLRLTGGPAGPAFARNHGCSEARGDIVVFLDADVCVHPDTLRLLTEAFDDAPDVGAVFGAYDSTPEARGLVTQYRNLLHHYTHLQAAGTAETFWAGCGALRREVLARSGGFDAARYPRPQIEDIELGHRIRDLDYRIMLRPDIQVKHLKQWTLRSLIVTDVRDRGVPWMRLLLSETADRRRRATLNITAAEKLQTAMVGAACGALALVPVGGAWPWAAIAGGMVVGVIAGNFRLLRWFARERGVPFALAVVPLRLLYYLLNGFSAAVGWFQHTVGSTGQRRPTPDARPAELALPRERGR